MILLYETDEEKPFLSRICRAFCYEIFFLIAVVILAMIAFGTMRTSSLNDLYYVKNSSFQTSEADLKFA